MTARYILGGAAVAGAGYYLYQQRLEQAHSPSGKLALPAFGSNKQTGEGAGEYTGRQLDEAALQAKDRLQDLSHEAGKKIDHTLASAEQQRSKLNSWASDKLQDAQGSLDAHANHAKEKAEILAKQAHRDDPNRLTQFGHEVKETIHDAKDSVSGSLHNAKQSIVGTKNAAEQRIENAKSSVKDTAQDAKDSVKGTAQDAKDKVSSSWFSLGETKEEELARKTRDSLAGWGETAAASSTEYYEAISTHPQKSKSWFSWGRKSDTQESVQKAYDDAQRSYEDAKKRFSETKNSWFSFKEDDTKKRLHAEAEKQLDAAQKQLDAASSKYNEWKARAKDAVYSGVGGSKQYKGFYDWLRGGVPYQGERVTRTSSDAVRGWGDTASDAAKDHYDANRDYKRNVKGQYNDPVADASKTAKEWKSWFNRKYDESAQGAQEYYNDADRALKDAQKELDAQSKHWWSWGQTKSKELELDAKRNVEEAEKRVSEATSNLSKWGVDVTDKLLRGAEGVVKQTRYGLDKANQKTQEGLGSTQSWIKDQQK